MNAGKVFLGILVGVAVGATLGILFAPDKGSQTRKKIIQRKDDYVDELDEKFNDFMGNVTDKLDKVSKEANRMARNGKQKVEDIEAEVISAIK